LLPKSPKAAAGRRQTVDLTDLVSSSMIVFHPAGPRSGFAMTMNITILFCLILVNGLFAMGEMAVISARRARLKSAAEAGDKGAQMALTLSADSTRFLSTVQIGVTLVSVLTGTFGGATLADELAVHLETIPPITPYAHTVAIAIVVIGITYMTLIFGELVPKRLALAKPEYLSSKLARFMRAVSIIATPAGWLLAGSTNLVLALFPWHRHAETPVTDEEIRILMQEGTDAGQFEEAEKSIVDMALRLNDRRVSALLTPRTQMEGIDLEDGQSENLRKILDSHYSRFPVFDGGLDKVVGILESKDLLQPAFNGEPVDLRAIVQKPLYIPETATALGALELFKRSGSPIALIVDEYGAIQGLLTLNDLMQSLVGDIATPGLEEDPAAVQRDDGSWLVDGMHPIDEVGQLIGFGPMEDDEHGGFQTLGGFMMAHLNRIPAPADRVTINGYCFEVMDMDGRRVDKVLVIPPAHARGGQQQNAKGGHA
jgi:putative hemolysin